MKKSIKIGVAVAAAAASITSVALIGAGGANGTGPHWAYQGEEGPNHWGEIDPSYAACADGSAQTPINITKFESKNLKNLVFNYNHNGVGTVVNNGHTVQLNADAGQSVKIGNKTYPFLQIHFHTPSEHEINGKHYPLEVHFVHKTDANEIAVVGIFVTEGREHNHAWDGFVSALEAPDSTTVNVDWDEMFPANKQTLRYSGSLTTPPCTEGVAWNIFTTPVELDREQINEFINTYNGNMRPVQPINGRKVYLDSTPNS